MTLRKLLGFTKNMGPFELSVAWGLVPASLKAQLPPELIDALDALAVSVVAYKAVISAYNAAKKALEATKQVNSAVAYPGGVPTPEPIAISAIVTEQTAKIATVAPFDAVEASQKVIDVILDTEIPATV